MLPAEVAKPQVELKNAGYWLCRKRNLMTRSESASSGIGFGCALAMVISYSTWHSVLWAIIHGLCSWLYVIYFLWTTHGQSN